VGTTALVELLSTSSVFIALNNQCHLQLCGRPISDLTPAEGGLPTIGLARQSEKRKINVDGVSERQTKRHKTAEANKGSLARDNREGSEGQDMFARENPVAGREDAPGRDKSNVLVVSTGSTR
jgi:hypothetical protein